MPRIGSTTVALIPARFASTRLPGKPLLRETGKFLIQHVYERAARVFSRVIVATDDRRILEAVRSFGGEAAMTSARHPNGTCRIAEVAATLKAARIVNVQGDEPEADAKHLRLVATLLDDAPMATIAVPFSPDDDVENRARVKVVLDKNGFALYFSRSRIPSGGAALLHLGLYAYTRKFLLEFVKLSAGRLEQAEKLEQLRALENGVRIRVGVVSGVARGGIDTPEDYRAFVERQGRPAVARKTGGTE
jgi:3-deoxy-manno-octulosonate cytidylyltransferase (CMP-KDO synthetase)